MRQSFVTTLTPVVCLCFVENHLPGGYAYRVDFAMRCSTNAAQKRLHYNVRNGDPKRGLPPCRLRRIIVGWIAVRHSTRGQLGRYDIARVAVLSDTRS